MLYPSNTHCRRLSKTTELFLRNINLFFYVIFTPTYFVFGLQFVYVVLPALLEIVLVNRKNTAQQLFNISVNIYKSFYHIAFLEVCRAYYTITDVLFISKKRCIEKPIDRFLGSGKKNWKTQ